MIPLLASVAVLIGVTLVVIWDHRRSSQEPIVGTVQAGRLARAATLALQWMVMRAGWGEGQRVHRTILTQLRRQTGAIRTLSGAAPTISGIGVTVPRERLRTVRVLARPLVQEVLSSLADGGVAHDDPVQLWVTVDPTISGIVATAYFAGEQQTTPAGAERYVVPAARASRVPTLSIFTEDDDAAATRAYVPTGVDPAPATVGEEQATGHHPDPVRWLQTVPRDDQAPAAHPRRW